jgi:hypothetical protein
MNVTDNMARRQCCGWRKDDNRRLAAHLQPDGTVGDVGVAAAAAAAMAEKLPVLL